jgi:hypothetical protein
MIIFILYLIKGQNTKGLCIFQILSYVDSNGVGDPFDSGRYSYDDGMKVLLRNKWRKSIKPKLLKGFTIMSQSTGAVKIDLTELKQQLGIWNWWLYAKLISSAFLK